MMLVDLGVSKPDMSREEARECVDAIHRHAADLRSRLFELHERGGWRSLGYDTWKDCIDKEFGYSEPRAIQQMDAYKVERILAEQSPGITKVISEGIAMRAFGRSRQLPETHARALVPLLSDPDALRTVYATAAAEVAKRDGHLTQAVLRAAVERWQDAKRRAEIIDAPAVSIDISDSSPPDAAPKEALDERPKPPAPRLDPSRNLPGQVEQLPRPPRPVQALRDELILFVQQYPIPERASRLAGRIDAGGVDLPAATLQKLRDHLKASNSGRLELIRAVERQLRMSDETEYSDDRTDRDGRAPVSGRSTEEPRALLS